MNLNKISEQFQSIVRNAFQDNRYLHDAVITGVAIHLCDTKNVSPYYTANFKCVDGIDTNKINVILDGYIKSNKLNFIIKNVFRIKCLNSAGELLERFEIVFLAR